MESVKQINANILSGWLNEGRQVSVLDIRPVKERTEWHIPGSVYFDAYDPLKTGDETALEGLYLDKEIPVVAVCAGGKMSLVAAGILQKKGFTALSLEGGMKAWSLSWNTAETAFSNFSIEQIRRTGKGCLSYIVFSGSEAVVVDASLPVEVYLDILRKRKLTLKYVIETHIHADHLSRSRQLAGISNASLHLPVPNSVEFSFTPIKEGSILTIGDIQLKAIHTPGHTAESTTYLIDDKLLLTGDTLFINGVGRPDLKASPEEVLEKAGWLHQSLQNLISLDEALLVFPSHTNHPVRFNKKIIQGTIGGIKNSVPSITLNKAAFIKTILDHIPPAPANYRTIVECNNKGDFNDINTIEVEAGANRCSVS